MAWMLIAVSILIGCTSGNSTPSASTRGLADSLYMETIGLIDAYSDTLAHSRDSAALVRAATKLEDALSQLNMRYPALSDTLLSPDRQLSINKHLRKYKKLRDSKWHLTGATDSTATDSIGHIS